ncbi:MarR family winged helix-turn-helix transcriptional regulator [Pseudonocardia spirodelae]|uniref:MarR family transcriptional regulator n=1 Tax=Pseudonocardia spirodelae TaxID=3133431 RepID=A0ABU8T3A8_9PSEU
MDDTSAAPPREHPVRRRVLPSPAELASWRSFLRAHAGVIRQLEAELEGEQHLSLAAYDVLVQLSEAPGRALRMTELADAVLLSRSGVTRLVDRLERAGLVARAKVEADGRGVTAHLTDTGFDRLRVAAGTHLRGVRDHFVERLDAGDLADLERIMRRLVP